MLQALIYTKEKKGYTNFTEFVFESRSVTNTSIQKYLWSISDGTFYYNTPKIAHKFFNSGSYTIKLTIWDEENKQQTTTISVTVQQFLSDSIYFENLPDYYVGAGQKTDTPITVSFTTTITSHPPVISLYADNSRSIPHKAPIKPTWNQLIPRWTFYDLSGNSVSELTATNYSPVYLNDILIGYKGYINFYFVEDIGINDPFLEQPTIIFATLKTTTQENSRLNSTQNSIQKATFWYTDKPIPTNLYISETVISDIYTTKWSGVTIPYLVTIGSKTESYKINKETPQTITHYPVNILKKSNSSINFTYPDSSVPSLPVHRSVTNTVNWLASSFTETSGTSATRLAIISAVDPLYTVSYPDLSTITFNFFVKEELGISTEYPGTSVIFHKNNSQGYPIGGFVFDSVKVHSPIRRQITLSATLLIPASSYKPSFFNNTYLQVYNPEVGLVNKNFSLPHTHKDLVHNKIIYDKVLETEWLESRDLNQTLTQTTTAYPEITNPYGVAFDPVDRVYWIADPDKNHIYKFNKDYQILTAINLVSYFDIDPRFPNSAKVSYDKSTPLHIKLDKDRNVWVSFYDQLTLLKLDKAGNIINRTIHKSTTRDAPAVTPSIKERNLSVYSLIDVDSQNNVWATHTEYLYNEMRKYSSSGALLSTIILPTTYNPTSIHIDRQDNIWLTVAITPYLLKPSQDRHGFYWDWYNLQRDKNTPLRWRDTRFVGLTNWVVEREIYPAGKYPKTWNRETFNGQSLKANYTFTVTGSSRTSPISSLSSLMIDVTAVDLDFKLEMMLLSTVTSPIPSTFILYYPVTGVNVFYDTAPILLTPTLPFSITPQVTAKVNMRIPSRINKYHPGLYNTETDYITATKRIVIEVPRDRKVYFHLPKQENYGTTIVKRVSTITSSSTTSATDLARITAMNPSYDLRYIDIGIVSKAVFNFTATLNVPERQIVYPISALPVERIIPNFEPGLFFRVYDHEYYMQNYNSLANTFTEYANFRYNTITTGSGTKIATNFYQPLMYPSENDLTTNQISSISDPITSVRQVIPTNYGNIYCFTSGGDLLKSYPEKFERPECIITDNDNKIWFTHNYNHFTVLDPIADTFNTWKIDTDTGYIFANTNLLSSHLEPNSTTNPANVFNNGIRGFHVDMFNRVWIVSNMNQKVYTFYAPFLTKYYKTYNANLRNSKNERHKLTQSFGDPTGNNWFQKYVIPEIKKTAMYVLTGQSNVFTLQPLKNNHSFRVKEESFDAKEQLKSYALPEILNRNTLLFDDFLGSILGNVSDDRENIGRVLYEKIANFTKYHSDIDFANIDTLYSLGQMLDVEIEQGLSKLSLPAEIKRLINFTSIPYKKLFGYLNKDTNADRAYLEPINTMFSFVTAGEILYIKEPMTNSSFTYIVPVSTNPGGFFMPIETPIPYSVLKIPSLQDYMFNNLEVYRMTFTGNQIFDKSFIDWNSNSTTLLSTTKVTDWYKDGGVIEEMFNYVLTKNLLT